MPKGPRGEKRPGDVIGAAVTVAKIATGEIEEHLEAEEKNSDAVARGQKGGDMRAKKLTRKQRIEIAKAAARRRWQKTP